MSMLLCDVNMALGGGSLALEIGQWNFAILSIGKRLSGFAMNIPSVFELSPSEKLQLVEDLWDDLAANPADVPVHDWQIKELAERKARLMQNPASGLSWEAVQQRVRSRYDR